MLSLTPRAGAGGRGVLGARACFLALAAAAVCLVPGFSPSRAAAAGRRPRSFRRARGVSARFQIPGVRVWVPRGARRARFLPLEYAADLSPGPSPTRGGGALAGGGSSDPKLRAESPPSLVGKGDGGLGSDAALQRLAEETDRIQPSAPDAVARLKAVVRELIDLERTQQREIAALQSAPITAASPVRRRARKQSVPAPAAASAAGAPARSSAVGGGAQEASGTAAAAASAATGMLFGKRGLKKVHRAGCIFGERIKAEDRVYFKSMQEAAAAGYAPCKICHPDR